MAITLEQVRAALEPEEPDYPKAAQALGTEALPHLERLIVGDHSMLASKAAYLAGIIGTEQSVPALTRAARSSDAVVRIAAAAAARNLPAEPASDLLLTLVDDADIGVQKAALRSVPSTPSDALKSRIEGLSAGNTDTIARSLSRQILGRPEAGDQAPRAPKPVKKAKARKAKPRPKK